MLAATCSPPQGRAHPLHSLAINLVCAMPAEQVYPNSSFTAARSSATAAAAHASRRSPGSHCSGGRCHQSAAPAKPASCMTCTCSATAQAPTQHQPPPQQQAGLRHPQQKRHCAHQLSTSSAAQRCNSHQQLVSPGPLCPPAPVHCAPHLGGAASGEPPRWLPAAAAPPQSDRGSTHRCWPAQS